MTTDYGTPSANAIEPQVVHLSRYDEQTSPGDSLLQTGLRRLRRDRLTLLAVAFILTMTVLSLLAPFISDQILHVSFSRTNLQATFLPVGTPGHILGTDDLGRDYLSRLLYAGQVSLGVAFFAALVSITIGVFFGIVAGYYGGVVDDLINWFITTLGSIPTLLLLLIIAAVFSSGPLTLTILLGLLGWLGTARLVRGETLAIRERDYILAARALGASPWRIMFVHIIPNLFSVLVITLALDIGALILTEAVLSFLGYGVKPPIPSWGNMLNNAEDLYTHGIQGPFLVIVPGLAITITVLCLYVIGDGLRDAFDPSLANK
jgi:peptide/nickel transport system permease protein